MTASRHSVDSTTTVKKKAPSDAAHKPPIDVYCLALVVGYGLYRALMNLTYSTALSSVPGSYPLNEANLEFSLATSLSIVGCSTVLIVLGCLHPTFDFKIPGIIAIGVLVALNLFSQIEWPLPGATVLMPGVYGVALIVANVAWLVPFTLLNPRRCLATLATCVLCNALMTTGLGFLSTSIQIAVLAIFGITSAIMLGLLDHIHTGHPVADVADDGPLHPHAAWEATCKVLGELKGTLIIYAAFTALTGFIVAFLFTDSPVGGSVPLNNLALAVAAAVMTFLALVLRRSVNLREVFKASAPVVALLFVILPFTGPVYGRAFCMGLVFISGIVNISTLFLLIDTSHMRGAPIVAVMSATTLLARLCLTASLVAGMILGAQTHIDYFTRTLIMVLGSVYLLAIAFMALTRKTRQSIKTAMPSLSTIQESVEIDAEDSLDNGRSADLPTEDPLAHESSLRERRSYELATQYHLTPREREILLLLARGRTSPYIARELNIAPNTVRSYMREIYTKLGAHSKQDVIDLFS